MMRYSKVFCLLLLLILSPLLRAATASPSLVIGGKNFTEQYILVAMANDILTRIGFHVTDKTGVSTLVLRSAIKNGQIDMYFEYTGTAYTLFYKQNKRSIMTNEKKVYKWVKTHDAKKGLTWATPLLFNNTYAIAITDKLYLKHKLQNITQYSQLIKTHPEEITIAVDAESYERPDGFRGLMQDYHFKMPADKIIKMDSGLVYLALKQNYVDSGIVFTTDGRINAFNLKLLQDNKHFFPVYHPALVIRSQVAKEYPKIIPAITKINKKLTTEVMRHLNYLVDVKHQSVKAVAKEWLNKNIYVQH